MRWVRFTAPCTVQHLRGHRVAAGDVLPVDDDFISPFAVPCDPPEPCGAEPPRQRWGGSEPPASITGRG